MGFFLQFGFFSIVGILYSFFVYALLYFLYGWFLYGWFFIWWGWVLLGFYGFLCGLFLNFCLLYNSFFYTSYTVGFNLVGFFTWLIFLKVLFLHQFLLQLLFCYGWF